MSERADCDYGRCAFDAIEAKDAEIEQLRLRLKSVENAIQVRAITAEARIAAAREYLVMGFQGDETDENWTERDKAVERFARRVDALLAPRVAEARNTEAFGICDEERVLHMRFDNCKNWRPVRNCSTFGVTDE